MADHRQCEDDLLQPSSGHRQREQDLVGVFVDLRWRKGFIQRGARLAHLAIDEWTADTVAGGHGADGFSARQARTAIILRSQPAGFTETGQTDEVMGTPKLKWATLSRTFISALPVYAGMNHAIGGDGAYDTKPCHAQIAARGAAPSIPPREGAMPWPDSTPGAAWRNEVINAIAQSSRREWKKSSGYHRRSLVETLMFRLKTLTGNSLWARKVGSQATEVAIRVGVLNRMTALARPQSVRIA